MTKWVYVCAGKPKLEVHETEDIVRIPALKRTILKEGNWYKKLWKAVHDYFGEDPDYHIRR